MTLLDGCLLDELSDPSVIDDFDYYIASTGLKTVSTPTFTQLLGNCDVDWSLVTVDQGQEEALTATQASFVSLQVDGSINIDVGSDYSVVDQLWTFRLKATSTESSVSSANVVDYDFTVSLLDGCSIDTLSNPSSISSFDYFIDVTGLRIIPTPTYTQEVANCDVSWSLVTVENG